MYRRRLFELIFIAICLLLFAGPQRDLSVDIVSRGTEFSYLTNSGIIAGDILKQYGTIPLWNPLIGRGEPLIENPFSFVLNPLMSVPIWLFGTVVGVKIAVLLHIVLMGWGGWFLADQVGLGTPGRLLLALLLGGSGSMAGSLGEGFYQMGVSQAYVPWILAGWIGILYRLSRAVVGVFVVFSALLMFGGIFWYVLPTAITGLWLLLFAMPHVLKSRETILQIGLAAGLALLLSAVRWLPQLMNHRYVVHQQVGLSSAPELLELVGFYFYADLQPEPYLNPIYYHFILPLYFLVAVGVVWLGLSTLPRPKRTVPRWGIVIPFMIAIVLYTLWAKEDAGYVRWLHETIPLLREWRYLGRMMAAATPLVATIAALMFDDVVGISKQNWMLRGVVIVISLVGVAAPIDVLWNWNHATGMNVKTSLNELPLQHLRSLYPARFLPTLTPDFSDYFPFYPQQVRATFGNPEYRPGSLPFTLGSKDAVAYLPESAIGFEPEFADYVQKQGYIPVPGADAAYRDVLWENHAVPSYAYVADEAILKDRTEPLSREDTRSVDAYFHRYDSIQVQARGEGVLVVTETAYPGWQVKVDGERADLESVGGLLGVRLDSGTHDVVFAYRPRWYIVGAVLTIIGAFITALYLLRVV